MESQMKIITSSSLIPRPQAMAAAKPSSSPVQSPNLSAPYIPPAVTKMAPAMMMTRDCRDNNSLTRHLIITEQEKLRNLHNPAVGNHSQV